MDIAEYSRLVRNGREGEYVDIDDIRMHYLREGTGPSVVLLHGGCAAGGAWQPIIDEMSAFDVIMPDSRGQGRSTDGRGPTTYGRMAGDTIRLLDYLGIERAHMVGHSDGGVIVLQLLIDYPDRVVTGTIAGTAIDVDDYRPGSLDQLIQLVRSPQDPVGFRGSYEALNPAPERWPIVREKLMATWLTAPKFTVDALSHVFTPVLVVGASDDEFIPHEAFTRATAALPNGEGVQIDGRHLNIFGEPERTAKVITDFMFRHTSE